MYNYFEENIYLIIQNSEVIRNKTKRQRKLQRMVLSRVLRGIMRDFCLLV